MSKRLALFGSKSLQPHGGKATVFDQNVDPAIVSRALATTELAIVWQGTPAVTYSELSGAAECDLLVIGAGYAGLWTALHAARRSPGRRILVVESNRVGSAASGRNGGFVEASLTHGIANGKSRWPAEMETLNALGLANLQDMKTELNELGVDAQWESTGLLNVATEPHQVDWLRQAAEEGEGQFLDEGAVRDEIDSPIYRAGLSNPLTCAIVHPAKLAAELARVCQEAGVEIFERTHVVSIQRDARAVVAKTAQCAIRARQVVLATNAFRSLISRNRLRTVPVYDYVLATEPLTDGQLRRIGWARRQGVSDAGNQFHYYRLTNDNRIVWGGYDAIYHYGRRVEHGYEDRLASYRRLAKHFFITFPQLRDVRFSHRWAGAVDANTRFCAHWGLAHRGNVAFVNGFTGLGVGATRFAADVCLDLLDGVSTERTQLEMVRRRPLPFPPEPFAYLGIQATRWSLNRADHAQGRRNFWLRTLDAAGLGFDS